MLGNREKQKRAASDYAADRIKGSNLIGGGVLVSSTLLEVAEYVFQRNLKKSTVGEIRDSSNQAKPVLADLTWEIITWIKAVAPNTSVLVKGLSKACEAIRSTLS